MKATRLLRAASVEVETYLAKMNIKEQRFKVYHTVYRYI